MKKKLRKCCLCEAVLPIGVFGNNPAPLAEYPKVCCDKCNREKVIPARLAQINKKQKIIGVTNE